jgi:hypothetical protein
LLRIYRVTKIVVNSLCEESTGLQRIAIIVVELFELREEWLTIGLKAAAHFPTIELKC